MIEDKDKFIRLITQMYELYDDVKLIIILSENFYNKNKTYIAIILELRNTLDHIMRSISPEHNTEKEFQDGIDHLIRAGYDAYENISITLGQKIIDDLSGYDKDIISKVFPDYYKKIRPAIANIKSELGEIRAGRVNNNGKNCFKEYGEKIQALVEYYKEVEFQIPELENQSKKAWKKIRAINLRWIFGIIATLIISLIIVYLRHYLTNH